MKSERRSETRFGNSGDLSRLGAVLRVVCLLSLGAPFLSAQLPTDLVVNKYQFSGDSATIAATEACITAQQGLNLQACNELTNTGLGSPVLYVITISNSSPITNTAATVYDTAPTNFVWVPYATAEVQCLAFAGAACTGTGYGTVTGTFNANATIGPFTIPNNGVIVLYVFGYYTSVGTGTKTNFVSSVATDLAGTCSGHCSATTLTIPNKTLLTDLGITKTTTATTTSSGTGVNYTITITNNGPGDDIYTAGLIQVADALLNASSYGVSYVIPSSGTGSIVCAPAVCTTPTGSLSGSVPPFTSANPWIVTFLAGTSIPVHTSVTITFTATFTYADCLQGAMQNQVGLGYSDNSATISDSINTNNSNSGNPVSVTLLANVSPCPTSFIVTKTQVSPINPVSWVQSPWGTPNRVTFQIVVTPSGPATGVTINDFLAKTPGTPVFTGNITTPVACVPSSACGTVSPGTPVVGTNYNNFLLFSIAMNPLTASPVTITYTVEYDPECETNPGPDAIINTAEVDLASAKYSSQVQTNLVELPACQLSVCKVNYDDASPNPAHCTTPGSLPLASLTFPPSTLPAQTQTFTIFFQNLSTSSLTVGTVRDVLSVCSGPLDLTGNCPTPPGTYGSFPITYQYKCTPPGSSVFNPISTPIVAIVQWNNPVWAGVTAIDLGSSTIFPASSTMTCKLTVSTLSATAAGLPSTGNLPTGCQDAGLPQLVNSAFMDLTSGSLYFNTGDPHPTPFGQASLDLPLCQNVTVTKEGTTSVEVGQPASFTITAANNESDPVNGFSLTDPLPAGFNVTGTPSCSPSLCTVAVTTNAPCPVTIASTCVTVTWNTIPAGQSGTLNYSATAPSSPGTFTNKGTGAFAPCTSGCDPAGSYSHGNLVSILNGQVLTDAFVEVCKSSSSANPVTGTFTFTSPAFANPITVPVGECSGPIGVGHGSVVITETAVTGVTLSGVSAAPAINLITSNLATGTATITAVAGNVSAETVVTFTNQTQSGNLKICKIAGPGIAVGTPFSFTATGPATPTGPGTTQTYTVTAGPASEGGYCIVDSTTFPIGTNVTVAEKSGGSIFPFYHEVSSVVLPAGMRGGSKVVATIGTGFTEVTFTNSAVPIVFTPTTEVFPVVFPSLGTAGPGTQPLLPTQGIYPSTPATLPVTPCATCSGTWTAVSTVPWVVITSGASGTGAGTVSYNVFSNTNSSVRSGEIQITLGSTTGVFPIEEGAPPPSTPVLNRQVTFLYQQTLGREPDSGGFTFWSAQGALALGTMTASFLDSAEAQNTDFQVMGIYQALTGAAPSYATYLAALQPVQNGGTAQALFTGLLSGTACASSTAATVTCLYQNLLGRAPTGTELSAGSALAPFTLFTNLFTGAEFQSTGAFHTDHTNSLYLTMLYFLILERDPDAGGFAFWLGVANGGGPGIYYNQIPSTVGAGSTQLLILGNSAGSGFTGSAEFLAGFQ